MLYDDGNSYNKVLYGELILNIQKKQHLISFLKTFISKVCAMEMPCSSNRNSIWLQRLIVHELSEIILLYL